jgi:hypothetical protein
MRMIVNDDVNMVEYIIRIIIEPSTLKFKIQNQLKLAGHFAKIISAATIFTKPTVAT